MNLKPENIPNELKPIAQWVAWRAEVRDGKPTKVPVNPHTGANAAVNDPDSWSDFAAAEAAARANGLAGVGFVLTADDDYFALDLDKCIDDAGVMEPWATEIVAAFPTYSEITPSGRGLRVIGVGKLPPGLRRDGRLEMYDSGRFVTLTGNILQ